MLSPDGHPDRGNILQNGTIQTTAITTKINQCQIEKLPIVPTLPVPIAFLVIAVHLLKYS